MILIPHSRLITFLHKRILPFVITGIGRSGSRALSRCRLMSLSSINIKLKTANSHFKSSITYQSVSKTETRKPTSKSKFHHIRKRIPSFDIPAYRDRRYETMVPDTLDIQDGISLAANSAPFTNAIITGLIRLVGKKLPALYPTNPSSGNY